MPTEPTKGQTVFDRHGRSALYVARVDDGHIVQPLFEDGDGVHEPQSFYAEGAEIWPAVHTDPPREVLHAEVAELQAKVSALSTQVYELESAKRAAASGQREVKERLQQHAALRYVDEFLAGKFKLFVRFPGYGVPTIEDAETCLNNKDRFDKGMRLLVLFGESKGDLQWRINQYRDGSGSWSDVMPIASEAEGIAEIRTRYEAAVVEWRALPEDRKHYGPAVSWAALPRDWIAPPADVLTYIESRRRASAEEAAAKAREALAKAEAALAALNT